MKKKTLQFFAAFLSLVMLSTSSSLSTLALGKDSITESQISNQYQAELHQMGFTDSDTIAEFMENGLDAELEEDLGYSRYP